MRPTGLYEIRWAHLEVTGRRLYQPVMPDRQGFVQDLGPDWREALGALVTEVLVDRVPGR